MSRPHIVVVDDEEAIRETLCEFCEDEGYQVTAVADGPEALQTVKSEPVQAVVTDLVLPGMDGMEVLERVLQVNAQIACIVMTGYGTIERAVRAMKAGAFEFITKPLQMEAVGLVLRKALEFQELKRENLLLKQTVQERYGYGHLVGTSEAMRRVVEFVERVADSDSTVLIQGESGTGKELVARMLHFNSLRRDRPLVSVNCGAIPEALLESELFGHEKGAFTGAQTMRLGRFEMAHGGTLFLDEVGEMSLPLQVKLLRVLQERAFERVGGSRTIRVDVRIIAATNQDLEQAVAARRFRKDLFYRLNVIPITLPPLRARLSDVPLLVEHFIRHFNETKGAAIRGVEPDALDALSRYPWPGNIRELEHLVERLVILKQSGRIAVTDLPEQFLTGPAAPRAAAEPVAFTGQGINLVKELEEFENRLIREALRQANGVVSRAAQLLHLNRTTLVEKLKRKGLDPRGQAERLAGDPTLERGT
ncbi:sigma-54-dependent transcriptional regulator [Nitrospira sp. Kam-Ns4a]